MNDERCWHVRERSPSKCCNLPRLVKHFILWGNRQKVGSKQKGPAEQVAPRVSSPQNLQILSVRFPYTLLGENMTPKDPFLEGTFWNKFWRPIRSPGAFVHSPKKGRSHLDGERSRTCQHLSSFNCESCLLTNCLLDTA